MNINKDSDALDRIVGDAEYVLECEELRATGFLV